MSKKTQATARVQLTVELDAGSAWGDECTIGQIHAQASEGAIGAIRRLFSQEGSASLRAKIVGEPKVLGIITERP